MRRILLFLTVLACALAVMAQDSADHPVIKKGLEAKFTAFPAPLDCLSTSTLRGDPAKGPSVMLVQADAGCTIPWHWHSVGETIYPISGLLQVGPKEGKATVIKSGDYAYMPAKHVHQAKCAGTKPCAFYLQSDGIFDLHFAGKDGNEITPEKAVGDLNKNVKKPPKEN